MEKIRLNVMGLSYSQTQAGAYALVLAEESGQRRIPIIIGGFEAQAIAIELEGLKPPRPLTHDLLLSLSRAFNIVVEEVNIFKLEEGIFHAELICNNGKSQLRIDARTSDAVAIALRFKCPIFTTEEIMSKAGIILDQENSSFTGPDEEEEISNEKQDESLKTAVGEISDEELKQRLNQAIENEDYEKASALRDEMIRRGLA